MKDAAEIYRIEVETKARVSVCRYPVDEEAIRVSVDSLSALLSFVTSLREVSAEKASALRIDGLRSGNYAVGLDAIVVDVAIRAVAMEASHDQVILTQHVKKDKRTKWPVYDILYSSN